MFIRSFSRIAVTISSSDSRLQPVVEKVVTRIPRRAPFRTAYESIISLYVFAGSCLQPLRILYRLTVVVCRPTSTSTSRTRTLAGGTGPTQKLTTSTNDYMLTGPLEAVQPELFIPFSHPPVGPPHPPSGPPPSRLLVPKFPAGPLCRCRRTAVGSRALLRIGSGSCRRRRRLRLSRRRRRRCRKRRRASPVAQEAASW